MYVLLVLRGDRGDNPGLARLVDRVVPTPKKKQLKRKFLDSKQKKNRKERNQSLSISNYKIQCYHKKTYECTLCFLFLRVFF